MRNLIHYEGDFHQPFHMINQYSNDHPNGDNSGKDYKINHRYKSIHNLWDNCLGFIDNEARPYNY